MTDRRALVTGATGNVGQATTRVLRAAGWRVQGVSREQGLDLADANKVRTFAADQREGFDLLVVAHGVVEAHTFRDADLEEWERIVDGNLQTTFNVVNALLRWNLVKAGGLLVFCSSIQATQTRAGRGLYAVAMAGREAMARALAVELSGRSIRSVALRLGQLTTTMKGVSFSPEQVKAITDRLPAPLVPPEEVARLVLTLWTLKSVTGAVWDVDSGHNLAVWP